MKKYTIIVFILTIFFNSLYTQPDSRFRPFDWILYKGAKTINSITEGYSYIYVATESGGLKRFNLFGNRFDEPITMAQGLKENNINATHFDLNTGIIWIVSNNYLQYSFSREGDWYTIRLKDLGLSKHDKIDKIGSSIDYIWLKAKSTFYKLDHSSGILIGIYPIPDEKNIKWSSGEYINNPKFSEIIMHYGIMDGYVFNGDELIDNLGRRTRIQTIYFANHGNIFFGTDDGTLFNATTTMQVFTSYTSDIINTDVSSLFFENDQLWIGSLNFIFSKGITTLDVRNNYIQSYQFEQTINMNPTPIYSISVFDGEVWAGGEDIILNYNIKKNFWRTLGSESIGYVSKIFDIHTDSLHVWIASSSGLNCVDRKNKRQLKFGVESLFNQISVYDLEGVNEEIWIATDSDVYILSVNNPQIRNSNEIGRKDFPQLLNGIKKIKSFDNMVYVLGEMGIATFDLELNKWDLFMSSAYYDNKIIHTLAVNKKYIFLGSNNSLIRLDKNTSLVKEYEFEFLGKINDLYFDNKILWIGSSEGLIKFKWKRDI